MLDTNTIILLNSIRCPIIYIGDYCQLPPVNENLSDVFNADKFVNLEVINLCKVERCKNSITLIANALRDKIYNPLLNFNLLTYKIPELIIYKSLANSWLNAYIKDINNAKAINTVNTVNTDIATAVNTINTINTINDNMVLAWTNNCCNVLNKKIREKIFTASALTASGFLIKGDKLLIKTPYYKYGHKIFPSSITYVNTINTAQYKPLAFTDWCMLGNNILQDEQKLTPSSIRNDTNSTTNNNTNNNTTIIDINNILNDDANDVNKATLLITTSERANMQQSSKATKQANIRDYFNKQTPQLQQQPQQQPQQPQPQPQQQPHQPVLQSVITPITTSPFDNDISRPRKLFYQYHNLQSIINIDLYKFTDELSLYYNKICDDIDLLSIHLLQVQIEREDAYTKWHIQMSILLFGIPNDTIMCKKCLFFIKKFTTQNNTKNNSNINMFMDDMNNATTGIILNTLLCELSTTATQPQPDTPHNTQNTQNTQNTYYYKPKPKIAILDTINTSNIKHLENIKKVIKQSYDVKITLNRKDEFELKTINKILNEDDENATSPAIKYITLSQLFGHYLSHVITNTYIEVEYGYALTVHKSQGSTYDNVYVEYNNLLSNSKATEQNKLLYTAITRCKHNLHIYYT